MTALRERMRALRTEPRQAPVLRAAPCGPEVRVQRRAVPGWPCEDAGRRLMSRLAVLADDREIEGVAPRDLLFLDLETTGLSVGAGTIAFLVGLAHLEPSGDGHDLVIEQRMLRGLAHERDVLEHARGRVAAAAALVSFNGKSFDVPLLGSRWVMNRLAPPRRRPHFDALHPARRLLKDLLPDVRLGSLELALWGRRREDDIDGAAIPAAFHAALRGDDGMLDDVLRHNAQDLATLADLLPLLAGLSVGERAPTGLTADDLAIADTHLRAGERDQALRRVKACQPLPGSPRGVRRARLARRAGGPEAARECWRALCRAPRGSAEPFEELAKILEHHDRDFQAALDVVESGLRSAALDEAARARLAHRRGRLERKLARRRPGRTLPRVHDPRSGPGM